MVETFLRQSPLAGLSLASRAQEEPGSAGATMAERAFPVIVNLRGDPANKTFLAAAKKALGVALPLEARTAASKGDCTVLWIGPNEWWATAPDRSDMSARLSDALEGPGVALTDIGESRTVIRISGPRARDTLAKGCTLDLHPRAFGAGRCSQTLLAKATVVIHQVSDEPVYDLYVLRSFAEYLWLWLEDAAQEYGMVVLAG